MKHLFNPRVMYDVEHDARGRSLAVKNMKYTARRAYIQFNMHLHEEIRFDQRTSLPIMEAYTGPLDFIPIAYSKRKKVSPAESVVHFFAPDATFCSVFDKIEKVTADLKDFPLRMAPDYSLYQNVPEAYNYFNVFRSRFCGAYWQRWGFPTIPTVSWGSLSSFYYCLAGLPRHSVLAVCGTGLASDENYTLWCKAMKQVEDALAPIHFIIYGEPMEVTCLHTPLSFINPQYLFFNHDKANTRRSRS